MVVYMDLMVLDADKVSKEKSKWGDDNKVYTRRSKASGKKPVAAAAVTVTAASPTVADNRIRVDTDDVVSETVQNDDLGKNREASGNGAIEPVVSLLDVAAAGTVTAASPTILDNRKAVATDDVVLETVQNDVLVKNREANGNGAIEPVVSLLDDGLVKINLKAAKSRDEVIKVTEMIKVELDKVRSLTRKLEDKEAEVIAFSAVVPVANVEAYNHSQYVGNNNNNNNIVGIRPFRELSVSVGNNNYGFGEFVDKRTPKANTYYQSSEFLLGKDRLPPESNKRGKSNSGRKVKKESLFKKCSNLLQRLMKHKYSWLFNEPVNVEKLRILDYHDIIKHPMDLGTVKSRLAQSFYKSATEFVDDIRLTFHNAMTYNPKGHEVHIMAEVLLEFFEQRWAVIESESGPDLRFGMLYDPNTPTPTSKMASHFAPAMTRQKPARTPVLKKPKAREQNKRNMTYEEKQKLSTNLQSLPAEKLDSIVQIIKKNTPVSQQDDEIEVDIDSVDVETLWELDRFVNNFKKNSSKRKRKAELAQQARAQDGDVNPNPNPNPTVVIDPVNSIPEAPKEDKTNEKTQGENASSSSSSSSDSSSSDSDSDSSSEDASNPGQA